MRNLKRALSLALASIMLLGMMVVGTSAASINDFTDADSVNNKEAVAIATGLGIFDGYDDGSFGPDRVVTRAEMAVVICKILHGSDVQPSNFAGAGKFTDVPAWAEGYVNMCSSLGIIEGYGDGKFGPNDTVTTVQASTMLLKALGYFQKDTAGALGADWNLEVTSKATSLGLYGDLTLGMNAGLTRENVAELTFNTLFAQRVAFDDYRGLYVKSNDRSVVVTNGTVDPSNTLAQNTFGLYMVEGVVTANGYTDEKLSESLKSKAQTEVMFSDDTDLNQDGKNEFKANDTYSFEYETGLNMIGHAARVYYKMVKKAPVVFAITDQATLVETIAYNKNTAILAENANDAGFKKNTILDVDVADYFVNYDMYETVADAVAGSEKWADDTTVGINATYGYLEANDNTAANKNLVVISNSGNYTVDYVIVLDQYLDVVNDIDTDKDFTEYTMAVVNGAKMNTTEYEVAKKDYVIVTNIGLQDDVLYFQPAETVTANITDLLGLTNASHTITGVVANGVEYAKSKAYANNGTGKLDEIVAYAAIDKTGSTVMILDQFGKLIAIESKKAAPNYAYVAEYGIRHTTGSLNTLMALTAKVYFADGTSGIYEIDLPKSDALNGEVTNAMVQNNEKALKKALNNSSADDGHVVWSATNIVDHTAGNVLATGDVHAARGLYNVNVHSDGVTADITKINKAVTEATAAGVELVKSHSTLLEADGGAPTGKKNVVTTALGKVDLDGDGTASDDPTLYQNNDTVYFYVNFVSATEIDVQATTGIKTVKGFVNGTPADSGIKEAFAQLVGVRAVMETMLVANVELANNTNVFYHDQDGYKITHIGDGNHTITYFMYNAKTGEREDVTYDNNGKYWSASAAQTHVNGKFDGWYTLGANDINVYAAQSDATDKYEALPKNGVTYITNDTAGYDKYVENLFGQSSKLGAILDMDTVIVKDICGSGLTNVDKLVKAIQDDGKVNISFTWNGDYETFVIFVTYYDPDTAVAPGGAVGVYGFDNTLEAKKTASNELTIETATLANNGVAGDTTLDATGNLTVTVSVVNGGTTVNLGTQTVKNVTFVNSVLSATPIPGFTLATGQIYQVIVTFSGTGNSFTGTYSLST